MKKLLAVSLLSADIFSLKQEIANLEAGGIDMLHIDIMDGHFVPHITFGHEFVKKIRSITKLPLDVHLMVSNPESHIHSFAQAGADFITIHLETVRHLDKVLRQMKSLNVKTGVALLPSTLPNSIDYIIDLLDLVLVMTVNPGFAGQEFITSQLDKISIITKKIKKSTLLSVDGGINDRTIKDVSDAGANVFVSGNYIYHDQHLARNIKSLRNILTPF